MKKIWNNLPHEVKHFIFAWSLILGSLMIATTIMGLIFKWLNI